MEWEPIARLSVFLGGFALFALLEAARPRRARAKYPYIPHMYPLYTRYIPPHIHPPI